MRRAIVTSAVPRSAAADAATVVGSKWRVRTGSIMLRMDEQICLSIAK